MKRMVRSTVAAAGLAFFAQTAWALPTLIFFDDFENDNARVTSPLVGQPGAGLIGSTNASHNFWTPHGSPTTPALETDGYLQMTAESPDNMYATSYFATGLLHPEFSFINTPVGQGILFSVREYWRDWGEADAVGYCRIGFVESANVWDSFHGRTNKAFLTIYDTGAFDFMCMELANNDSTRIARLSPTGDARPTGFDLYLDSQYYELTVYYNDDSTKQTNNVHNLTNVAQWAALRLRWERSPRVTGQASVARIGEITVTQIPEPGAFSLGLAALGGALLVRRHCRRRPSA